MSDFNNDLFDDSEESSDSSETTSTRTSSNGNNFKIIIGILGAVFVVALVAIIIYALLVLPKQNAARLEQAAQINAQNTATSMAATSEALLMLQALTPSATLYVEPTAANTPTPVVVFPTATEEPPLAEAQPAIASDSMARTATVAALLTMAAGGANATATRAATITALPTTGFADEVGLPMLLVAGVVLLGVLFLARRLRLMGSQN
jgi:hypothetical protein